MGHEDDAMQKAKRAQRRRRLALGAVGVAAVGVWLGNASFLADPLGSAPRLLAHRGLAQDFDRRGLTSATCTAERWVASGHRELENTIASMQAAFDLGADWVEFDVHQTVDGRFAVFHDWTVDCRTEGTGETRDHTLAELQALDIGYGYTADGETFPFRGQGIGQMPSLEEVLRTFPDHDFVIDLKSNEVEDGVALAQRLAEAAAWRTGEVAVYGGWRPVAAIGERLPDLRTMTRRRLKSCLLRYLAVGWAGRVPDACRQGLILVPANVAPWLWGWPNRFLQRMESADSGVFLIGDYGGEGFSRGFDDPERLDELPSDYGGGIWTDRIDEIGPALTGSPQSL